MIRFPLRLLVSAALFAGSAGLSWAEDIRIDRLKVGEGDEVAELRQVEVMGSNLSRDEIAALFAPTTTDAQRLALAAKLKASRASIAELIVGDASKGAITVKGFKLESVDQGRVGLVGFEAVDSGPMIDGVPGSVRSGPLRIEDIDLSSVLRAIASKSSSELAPKARRISWRDIEVHAPDDDTPATAVGGNLVKLRVGLFESEADFDGDMFLKGRGRMNNFMLEFPRASEEGRVLASLGYERLDLGASWNAGFDPKSRVLSLEDFTLSGAGIGGVTLRLQIGNLDPSQLKGPQELQLLALLNTQFISTELVINNAGIFEKGVQALATEQGKKPDELRQEASATVMQFTPLLMGGDPSSLQIAGAVGEFIKNPKSLNLSVKAKGAPLAFSSINMGNPMGLLQLVTITASANGAAPR